jgi:hypothetical protein
VPLACRKGPLQADRQSGITAKALMLHLQTMCQGQCNHTGLILVEVRAFNQACVIFAEIVPSLCARGHTLHHIRLFAAAAAVMS